MNGDKAAEELTKVVMTLVLVVGIVCLVWPVSYVVRVIRHTGSGYLLAALLLGLPVALLALLSQAAWLIWLAIIWGLSLVIVARVEERRLGSIGDDLGLPPLPFEGYLW